MNLQTAVMHFGSKAALARALGIKRAAVGEWKTIPIGRQCQLEIVTQGALRADRSKLFFPGNDHDKKNINNLGTNHTGTGTSTSANWELEHQLQQIAVAHETTVSDMVCRYLENLAAREFARYKSLRTAFEGVQDLPSTQE